MRVQIGNWKLEKAQGYNANSPIVPIRLVANRLSPDKVNERILPQAFNKPTVDYFLKCGLIDWHHESVMGITNEARSGAILGRPTGFQWEGGLPVVYGNLTKANQIVRENILPHLEAEQPVFAASVGGNVRKARLSPDTVSGKQVKDILEIEWDHIAIAGAPYVMSPGSEVSLVKAGMFSEAEHRVVQTDVLNYADLSFMERDFTDFETGGGALFKTLSAGVNTTSIGNPSGFDAMQRQSIEGGRNSNSSAVETILRRLVDGTIQADTSAVEAYLEDMGYQGKEKRALLDKVMQALE